MVLEGLGEAYSVRHDPSPFFFYDFHWYHAKSSVLKHFLLSNGESVKNVHEIFFTERSVYIKEKKLGSWLSKIVSEARQKREFAPER